jgi:pseudaminic acid biosynthesis-associated methylase
VSGTPKDDAEETNRLAQLWAGDFGDSYTERNADAGSGRLAFWSEVVSELGNASALEVGCNVGGNLIPLASVLGVDAVAGVDVNEGALERLRERLPGIDARHATASSLPFPDSSFDLVYTTGVLIHIPDASLEQVMREIVRCSKRFVLCGEYYADETTEVPYRGQEGALFKRDYGALYRELFPELQLVSTRKLDDRHGQWDDITCWVFEKP